MVAFWNKKKKEKTETSIVDAPADTSVVQNEELTWDDRASQALEQAAAQAPVPSIMKKKIRNELKKAAEEFTKKDNRTTVSPEDLMQGLMSKLPANMRGKIENAAKEGPEGLKKLEKEMRG